MSIRTKAFREGMRARKQGKGKEDNPYLQRNKPSDMSMLGSVAAAMVWADGWIHQDKLIEAKKVKDDEKTRDKQARAEIFNGKAKRLDD